MGPVGICAIFKDEAPDLLEWIAYHLSIGFDHIVLYDNGSTDGGAAIIAESIFAPFVHVVDWPQRPGQLTAYQDFCDRLASRFEWVAFIDIDEFVHPLEHDSIKYLLPRYADAAGVQLQWLTFGPSGHVARPPGLVIDSYTLRLPGDHERCGWVKPLLRTADIVGVSDGPHVFNVRGNLLNARGLVVPPFAHLPPCHDVVVLNHYYTRSREDWDRKRNRGYVLATTPTDDYGADDFRRHDEASTVQDDRIRRFLPIVQRTLDQGPPGNPLPIGLGGGLSVRGNDITPRAPDPDQLASPQPSATGTKPRDGLVRALDDTISLLGQMLAASAVQAPPAPPAAAPAAASGPIVHVAPSGGLGNRMLQFMMAMKIASLVPGCRIANVRLKDWSIDLPPIHDNGPEATWANSHQFGMEHFTQRMIRGEIHQLRLEGVGHRLENLLDRADYARIFQAPAHRGVGYGPDHLVCPVRAGDLLKAPHKSYVLTPVEFYQEIVAQTRLRPVFVGKTRPSLYVNRLRAAFPQAEFLPEGDVVRDFEIVRQSTNILLSCSTFCWLAAWLSDVAQTIIMPVNGILNPRQHQQVDLLPLDDERYRFHLFPLNYAVTDREHAARHRAIKGLWREVSHEHLRQLLSETPRVPRRIEPFLPLFDEAYYNARFPTVRQAMADGWLPSGLEHFTKYGFEDGYGWYGFDLDEDWYATQYPMAAFEIAQGDYADARHHYVEIGRKRGYVPVPGQHG